MEKNRYGWTKEAWLAYKAAAIYYIEAAHNRAKIDRAVAIMDDRTD